MSIHEELKCLQNEQWATDERPHPSSTDEIRRGAEEISRVFKTIHEWFANYQDNIWLRMKVESPDLTNRIFEAQDDVDNAFARWKNGRDGWEPVNYALRNYIKAWREVAVACR